MSIKKLLQTSLPCTGEAEKLAVGRVLDSGYLGMGPEVAAFEQELASYLGHRESVVCVNTGTSALHLACEALGLGPGDEVLVPSLTYVASFQAIAACGARPVACDVRLQDGLLDLEDAGRRLTEITRAIMPVFYAGYAGDLAAVHAFASRHGLRVIEDAAHAFGSRSNGILVGGQGDITCFSFDPIKNITAGEGGAVVSRDPEIIERVREMRQLGIHISGQEDFDVSSSGWRFQMPDLMAAIGRTQLARFDTELKPARQALQQHYRKHLAHIPGLSLLETSAEVVPHIAPVRLPATRRDSVRKALLAAGFDTRVHYKPNHLLDRFHPGHPCPVAEQLFSELLTLPTHPGVSESHVQQMAGIIEAGVRDT